MNIIHGKSVWAALIPLIVVSCSPEKPRIEDIARAFGNYRLLEPRLASGFSHATCERLLDKGLVPKVQCAEPPRVGATEFKTLTKLGQRIGRLDQNQSARMHLQGVWRLAWGESGEKLNSVVQNLEDMLLEDSNNSRLLVNLSASYYRRAQDLDRPLDLLQALTHAERAVFSDPEMLEARFNHALYLERIGLLRTARDAWEKYLVLDSESGWSSEAREALLRLDEDAGQKGWEDEKPRLLELLDKGDVFAVSSLVDRHRQEARLLGEESLIAQWADAWLAGDWATAERQLAAARLISSALQSLSGESLLADSIDVIQAARGGALDDLARGHQSYSLAARLSSRPLRDHVGALAMLDQAERQLRASGTPFVLKAEFLRLVCVYQLYRHQRAVELARVLETQVASSRYKALAGRVAWLLGTSTLALGNPAEAHAAYSRAIANFKALGEIDFSMGASTLLGETLDFLGAPEAAWRQYLTVSQMLRKQHNRRRSWLLLIPTGHSADNLFGPEVALPFLVEAVHESATGKADQQATSLRHLGAYLVRAERWGAARRTLEEAQEIAGRISSAEDRETVLHEIQIELAKLLARIDPIESLPMLQESMSWLELKGYPQPVPEVLRARSGAYRILQEWELAVKDLDQAIEILEEMRSSTPALELQVSFFDRARSTFLARMTLALLMGEEETALQVAEAARGRALSDKLALPGIKTGMQSLDRESIQDLRRDLPQGATLLFYEISGSRLLIWEVTVNGLELHEQELTGGRFGDEGLRSRIRELREDLIAGRPSSAARDLFDLLVRPANSIAKASRLFVAPTGSMHSLPFDTLIDRDSGMRLVQMAEVSIVPSLRVFEGLRRSQGSAARCQDVKAEKFLVVADPAFDVAQQPFGLQRLPGSRRLAYEIEEAFRPLVVSGSAATSTLFLENIFDSCAVHLGVHALANDRRPLMSSLVLADDKKDPQGGILYARDLLGLALDRTQLVVLAGCRTANGIVSEGEGVPGLVWPFHAAGVPMVIASLWDVEDSETNDFFTSFYQKISDGVMIARALRETKIEMFSSSSERHVGATWAAFQLYGVGQMRHEE